jgi:hypothetical protein
MYRIDETDYGFKLTFGDTIDKEAMTRWYTAVMSVINSQTGSFGMMVDMRRLKPVSAEIEDYLQKVKDSARRKGMVRSVVILSDAVTMMCLRRNAKRNKTYRYERYINANIEPGWEQVGREWLLNEVDPDIVDVMALLSIEEKGKPASTSA